MRLLRMGSVLLAATVLAVGLVALPASAEPIQPPSTPTSTPTESGTASSSIPAGSTASSVSSATATPEPSPTRAPSAAEPIQPPPTPTSTPTESGTASSSIPAGSTASSVSSATATPEPSPTRAPSAAQPKAIAQPGRLTPGEVLGPNGSITAPNGAVQFVLQSDGNLVIYAEGGRVLWSSGTMGRGGTQLVMQADSNLVLYTATLQPVWASATRSADAAILVLQSDGNLVMYGAAGARWATYSDATVLRPGQVLRAGQSLVSLDGRWRIVVQGDGNLVTYQGNVAAWASGTQGLRGPVLVLQNDGNFVLYGSDGRYAWATMTWTAAIAQMEQAGGFYLRTAQNTIAWTDGSGNARLSLGWTLYPGQGITSPSGLYTLVMQTDGNLVFYQQAVAVWHSHTYGNADAKLVLQKNGQMYVVSAAGRVLWQSLPNASVPAFLQLEDDGNVVSYSTTFVPVWASKSSPSVLTDYPAQTTTPPIVTSRYVRNLRSDTNDATLMRTEGVR